ncbi:hypothetical protein GCM10027418_08610 [Mariniluteicoccus endophyticus]
MSGSAAPEKLAVSYLRVSTTRQMNAGADVDDEGNSIATQREANNAKAARLGVAIQKEFVEPGASAQTIEKRPVFKRLLAYLAEHPEVDYVLIYLRSRAFRNLGDAVITKRKLEAMGVKLVSAKEDFGDGIMADAMEAVTDIINEVQVRMSGEDIKVKMLHKVEMGGTNGRAKLGYLNQRIDHDGRQVNTITIDPERAPLIRKAYELFATGDYTLDRLAETMADLGLSTRPTRSRPKQPVSRSKLHQLMRDSYYYGIVTYKGEQYQGRHEPIIDEDLFLRVQDVLDRRSKRGQRDRVLYHYLKGLLFCDRCRNAGRTSRMLYVSARGRRGDHHEYFLCRGRQDKLCDLPYLPVAQVEDAIVRHNEALRFPEGFLDAITHKVEQAIAEQQQSIGELHAGYHKQLAQLAIREERLLDMAEDDALPREKVRSRLRQIAIERAKAESGLAENGNKLETGAEVLRLYCQLLEAPGRLYAVAPDDARRNLNLALFERIYVDEDRVGSTMPVAVHEEFQAAARAYLDPDNTKSRPVGRDLGSPSSEFELADLFDRAGSSTGVMVRERGFEPPRP